MAWLQTFSTSSATTGSTATSSVPSVSVSSTKKRPKKENGSTPEHVAHANRLLDSILHHQPGLNANVILKGISQALKEELQDQHVQQLPSSSSSSTNASAIAAPAAGTSAGTSAHKRRGAGVSRKFKLKPKRG